MNTPRLAIAALVAALLACGISAAAEKSFYKGPGLFSTRPSEAKPLQNIKRFGPVGMGIDLVQPAFVMKIKNIEEGSPAAATGKLKAGQTIETINGQKLADIDPRIQLGQILAKAVQGQGGNISLIASQAVLVDSFSVLDASSALGVSGSVNIQAPTKFLSGAIVPLEQQPVNVATLYGARCAAGSGGHFSTFVDSKADSLSPTPGSFLASPLLLHLASSAHAVADRSAGQQGSVILTASIAPLVLGHAGEPTTACP